MPTSSGTKSNLKIEYESEGFPASSGVTNGSSVLETSWDELIWAAVTVGRPNRQYVFKHGQASVYEALFRLSLVRMALQQRPAGRRLRRTEAAKTLDPSEKGAVSYFLGMAICKLFSARLLDAPWLLHLDVFRPELDIHLTGRSRPDLVGQTSGGKWVAFESKGRLSMPNNEAKNKAKTQAQRVVSIDGKSPSYHIGGIAFFRNDVLRFFWRDPEPPKGLKDIKCAVEDADWRYYYEPVFDLVQSRERPDQNSSGIAFLAGDRELDVKLAIHPAIFSLLMEGNWGEAKRVAIAHREEFHSEGYQLDGIRVVAGETWRRPFVE
ncbi:MAG TPA: hypothetical protein DCK93_13675 [Blastocatellia bacterium]|jgi:hypothetical protein|nr:hypothetical protein [Blastocatellia bacterium]HAF23931.1 hypothetical protein [Blastocatellia bacterium]